MFLYLNFCIWPMNAMVLLYSENFNLNAHYWTVFTLLVKEDVHLKGYFVLFIC